uniref:Uncharacterized protein n=1 Tax=Timema bartmani TaxID=61472 RepID=A0A7R9ET17_9NEOP|nr:unnamed protein product [Timema bartmani]
MTATYYTTQPTISQVIGPPNEGSRLATRGDTTGMSGEKAGSRSRGLQRFLGNIIKHKNRLDKTPGILVKKGGLNVSELDWHAQLRLGIWGSCSWMSALGWFFGMECKKQLLLNAAVATSVAENNEVPSQEDTWIKCLKRKQCKPWIALHMLVVSFGHGDNGSHDQVSKCAGLLSDDPDYVAGENW